MLNDKKYDMFPTLLNHTNMDTLAIRLHVKRGEIVLTQGVARALYSHGVPAGFNTRRATIAFKFGKIETELPKHEVFSTILQTEIPTIDIPYYYGVAEKLKDTGKIYDGTVREVSQRNAETHARLFREQKEKDEELDKYLQKHAIMPKRDDDDWASVISSSSTKRASEAGATAAGKSPARSRPRSGHEQTRGSGGGAKSRQPDPVPPQPDRPQYLNGSRISVTVAPPKANTIQDMFFADPDED
jgi:hypothetical protein